MLTSAASVSRRGAPGATARTHRAAARDRDKCSVSTCLLGNYLFFFSLSPRKAPNTGHHTGRPPPAREHISYHHRSATTFHLRSHHTSKRRKTRSRPLVFRLRTSDERQGGAQRGPPSYRKATLLVFPGRGVEEQPPLPLGGTGCDAIWDLATGGLRVVAIAVLRFLGGPRLRDTLGGEAGSRTLEPGTRRRYSHRVEKIRASLYSLLFLHRDGARPQTPYLGCTR